LLGKVEESHEILRIAGLLTQYLLNTKQESTHSTAALFVVLAEYYSYFA
jgi:hypothetical protein